MSVNRIEFESKNAVRTISRAPSHTIRARFATGKAVDFRLRLGSTKAEVLTLKSAIESVLLANLVRISRLIEATFVSRPFMDNLRT